MVIPAPERYTSFDIYRTFYKKIGDHEIEVGILVPKDLKDGPHPVFVKFHGGGLVSGTWSHPHWFANWLVPFVHQNNAIVVSPNYRLIPEHTGEDIQQDLADFWTWFRNGGVTNHLASQNQAIELDYTRVLAGGDSAGGYLAIQSSLTQPKGAIRAVLAQYPMTNYLRREPQDLFMGEPSPPPSIIDEHISTMLPPTSNTTISASTPPSRQRLSYALSAYARYNDFFGTGAHLWPISLLPSVSFIPPTLIIHGDRDTAVSVEDSRAFVRRVREVLGGDAEVRLVVREGEDHGFDGGVGEGEEWVREVVAWVGERWVG